MQVFTPEPSRSYSLSSNAMTADFSETIRDLVGGKPYKTQVTLKDQYGSEGESALDIPYVRELENLSGKSKFIVGVQYGTWREGPGTWPPDKPADPNSPYGGWKYLAHPLLGEYDSSDEFVIAKHLDWLSGYGVGLVLSFVDSGLTYRNTELLLKNPLASDCKIAATYDLTSMLPEIPPPFPGGSIDLSSKHNLDTLYQDFDSMAVDFFAQTNYFRIDDRPLVFLFGASDLKGDILLTLAGLKKQLMQSYDVNPFLIGDTVGFFDPKRDYVKPYDAVSRFSAYSEHQDICCSNFEQKLDELYSRWSSFARSNGVAFVPTATPGFVATRPTQKDWPVLSKSPERFSRQIEVAMKYVDKAVPILLVSTFNDLAENTTVEPTEEEGFQYLQTLKDELLD